MATEAVINAMPFDAQEIVDPVTGDVSYDRVYYSEDFANWMSTYFSNGVLVPGSNSITSQLRVSANGLVITVEPGTIVINGRTGWVVSNTSLDVASGGSSDRYDRIVVELDVSNRNMSLKVVQGGASAPDLVRSGSKYQMSLATVKVAASSAVAVVTDTRSDTTVCGISKIRYVSSDTDTVAVSQEVLTAYGLAAGSDLSDALLELLGTDLLVRSFNGATGDVSYSPERTYGTATWRRSEVLHSGRSSVHKTISISVLGKKRFRVYFRPYTAGGNALDGFNLEWESTLKNAVMLEFDKYAGTVIVIGTLVFPDGTKCLHREYFKTPQGEEKLCVVGNGSVDFGMSAIISNARALQQSSNSEEVMLNFDHWTSEGVDLDLYGIVTDNINISHVMSVVDMSSSLDAVTE